MYSFAYDAERVLLTIVQAGYWSLPVFRGFEQEFVQHHNRIRLKRKAYRVLADCRGFAVQSAEMGEAFARFYEPLLAQNRGPFAIITASMLNKIQAKRALPQPHVQVFAEMDEAMHWLFAAESLPE